MAGGERDTGPGYNNPMGVIKMDFEAQPAPNSPTRQRFLRQLALPLFLAALLASCGGGGDDKGGGNPGNGGPRPPACPAVNCPAGYVEVPANAALEVDCNFCVMAFEAKNVGGVATSQAANTPWVSISATNAFAKCRDISADGYNGDFALISNPEWMTIARNMENEGANWYGGVFGVSGSMLARGHSDNVPAGALAVSDTTNPYSDTSGDSAGDAMGSGWEQRRTHTLSNGNVVWDFAGNVYEWVDWDAFNDNVFTKGPTNVEPGTWFNVTDVSGDVQESDLSPSGSYILASANGYLGMGRWTGGNGAASVRGGYWGFGVSSGVFTLSLGFLPNYTLTNVGFRCVYRP